MYPEERIVLAINSFDSEDWYYGFLADPSEYLFDNGVKEVIFIVGSDEPDETAPSEVSPDELEPPDDSKGVQEPLKNKLQNCDYETLERIMENDPCFSGEMKTTLKFKTHFGHLFALDLWEFKLFSYTTTMKKRCEFNKHIKKLLQDKSELSEWLCHKHRRKKLERIYQIIGSKLNASTLAVHHGCIVNPKMAHCCICCNHHENATYHEFSVEHESQGYLPFAGTLLLGDIRLDFKQKADTFFKHYCYELKNTKVVQLSHHGADNGWNDRLIDDITSPLCYVSSSRSTNTKHPSRQVVMTILHNGRDICTVNENAGFDWHFFLEKRKKGT